MRVMMTGATGFVGFHTALALLEAGHEVSLLVRSVEKMHKLFGRGTITHYTTGDITDADKVREAMAACDAVAHCAAMVSTHAGDAEQVYRTNLQGTRAVIGGAVEQGIGSILHVSSVTALYDPQAERLDENSPPGKATTGYGRSKVACEVYVRNLQDAGHPIYITYPASVIGPDDPGLTEASAGLQTCLTAFVPRMRTGNQYVDVRDIAQVHLRLLEGQAPPGRFTLGGHYVPWAQLAGLLKRVTGRTIAQLPMDARLVRFAGRLCDAAGPFLKLDLPLTAEGATYATNWVSLDNGKVERDLGFSFRPVEDSFEDAIRWLLAAGHISARQAGRLGKA